MPVLIRNIKNLQGATSDRPAFLCAIKEQAIIIEINNVLDLYHFNKTILPVSAKSPACSL
jgi:hypothetical protein